ncbi:hypothetical protein [Kitasatospora kifunensis]|uniref:Uncharacterized protein n=1 Tax=Kitasatospora kifunensis TaxID=58351 RepID=A0A7W7QYL2_KITKI|nr:hypothetical protein [Kitasatospora kifunensis]MBB4922207.1 hypothetical protein [Kitasatospora kifunensis]
MTILFDPDAWRPDQRDAGYQGGSNLTPGQIVIWDRKPYRVVETRERNPLDWGDGSAMFHLRGSCRHELREYDKRWAAAVPGRRRSFYCEGHLSHHFDDSKTCTDVHCPSVDVEHRYQEWHRPRGQGKWTGCWCVAGDLTARLERGFGAGERS